MAIFSLELVPIRLENRKDYISKQTHLRHNQGETKDWGKLYGNRAGQRILQAMGNGKRVQEFAVSSATVELAAKALGCEPERIAKTLSLQVLDTVVLIVAAGDARIDNKKFKMEFHTKAKMPEPNDVEKLVGHAVGGVCPLCGQPGGKSLFGYIAQALFHSVSCLWQQQQRDRTYRERVGTLFSKRRLGGRLQKLAAR